MLSWATQRQLLRHTRMTLRKPKLYLNLVVGAKPTGTSEGYSDSKKKIKESKSSYPMEGKKKKWGRLIYSLSPSPQSFLIRSIFSPPDSLPLHIHEDEGLHRTEKGKVGDI